MVVLWSGDGIKHIWFTDGPYLILQMEVTLACISILRIELWKSQFKAATHEDKSNGGVSIEIAGQEPAMTFSAENKKSMESLYVKELANNIAEDSGDDQMEVQTIVQAIAPNGQEKVTETGCVLASYSIDTEVELCNTSSGTSTEKLNSTRLRTKRNQKLLKKKRKCDVLDDPYENIFHDSLVLVVFGQIMDRNTSVVQHNPFKAICRIGVDGHCASRKQRSYDCVLKWKQKENFEDGVKMSSGVVRIMKAFSLLEKEASEDDNHSDFINIVQQNNGCQSKAVTKVFVYWKVHPPDQDTWENFHSYWKWFTEKLAFGREVGASCFLYFHSLGYVHIRLDKVTKAVKKRVADRYILVAEKNMTEISIGGCYDSCSEQSRDCGFSELLTQWEEHPPDKESISISSLRTRMF